MAKTVYKVYDTTGAYLKTFSTYRDAQTFRITMGRYDWSIIPVITS